MIRLNLIVEGQTEETFVNLVLVEHLSRLGVFPSARCIRTGRRGSSIFRGGTTSYAKAKDDLTKWMNQEKDNDKRFTTMFDLYALPNDFPGYGEAITVNDPYQRVSILETAFQKDIGDQRFIPYIQLHEFEALILADPLKLNSYFEDTDSIAELSDVVARFDSPELIDDGHETAPSKRIIERLPEYSGAKVSAGPIVVRNIGLTTLREKCRHFGEWLSKLESLNESDLYG